MRVLMQTIHQRRVHRKQVYIQKLHSYASVSRLSVSRRRSFTLTHTVFVHTEEKAFDFCCCHCCWLCVICPFTCPSNAKNIQHTYIQYIMLDAVPCCCVEIVNHQGKSMCGTHSAQTLPRSVGALLSQTQIQKLTRVIAHSIGSHSVLAHVAQACE